MRTILSSRLAHLRVIGSLWAAGGAERALTKVRHSPPRAPLPNLLRSRSAVAALTLYAGRRRRAQALDLDELPVLVDVLNASQQALQRGGGLELLQARLAYVSLSRLRSARRARRLRDVFLTHASTTAHMPPSPIPSQDCLPAISRLIDSCYEDYLLCGLTTTASLLKPLAPLLRDTLEVARADGSHGGGAGLFRGSAGVDLASDERRDRCLAVRDGLRELQPRLVALAAGRGRSAQLAARVVKTLARSIGD